MFSMMMIALVASAQATELLEIPRVFWGEYNEILGDCGTGLNDSRLRVSWDRLQFYESVGQLRELIRLGDGSIVVLLDHGGEGQSWTAMYHLKLTANGQSLSITHPQTEEMQQLSFERLRCPSS